MVIWSKFCMILNEGKEAKNKFNEKHKTAHEFEWLLILLIYKFTRKHLQF